MKLTLADVMAHLQLIGSGQSSPYSNAEMIMVIEQHQEALVRMHGIVDDKATWEAWKDEIRVVYQGAGVQV